MQATRVIPSFLGAMYKHQIIQFDQNALDYWIIEMFLQTMKPATVQRYLGTLHTIYKGYTNFTPPPFRFSTGIQSSRLRKLYTAGRRKNQADKYTNPIGFEPL